MKKTQADIPLPTTTMYAKKASNFAKRRGHNILHQKVFGGRTFLSIFLSFYIPKCVGKGGTRVTRIFGARCAISLYGSS